MDDSVSKLSFKLCCSSSSSASAGGQPRLGAGRQDVYSLTVQLYMVGTVRVEHEKMLNTDCWIRLDHDIPLYVQ